MRCSERQQSLVVFAPLPPKRNGIADYVAGLLPLLRMSFRCTCVVADGETAGIKQREVLERRQYQHRQEVFAVAPHLYHLGNSPDHEYMLPLLVERPGIVVLHDTVLYDLMMHATLSRDGAASYRAALAEEYGWPGEVIADQFLCQGLREASMASRLPMLGGVLLGAHHVIVHSRHAAAQVRIQGITAPMTVIPHYAIRPPPSVGHAARRLRNCLGLSERGVLITSLGLVTPAKQIELTLRALSAVKADLPPFHFVVAGDASAMGESISECVRSLGLSNQVKIAGYWPAEDIGNLLAATDILVNLRYPTSGETSGSLMRALGAGTCAIINTIGAFGEIPAEVACQLSYGPDLQARLAATLLRLATDPGRRRAYGSAARRWARARSVDASAAGYRAVIRSVAGESVTRKVRAREWSYRRDPPLAPPAPCAPIWEKARLLPMITSEHMAAVVASSLEAERLQGACRVVTSRPTCWEAVLTEAAPQGCDILLLSQPARNVAMELGSVFRCCARLLTAGGLLIVELDDADAIPLADDVAVLLVWAGFQLRSFYGAAPSSVRNAPEAPQTRRAWVASKASLLASVRPGEAGGRR